jgi:hypothetical protein
VNEGVVAVPYRLNREALEMDEAVPVPAILISDIGGFNNG